MGPCPLKHPTSWPFFKLLSLYHCFFSVYISPPLGNLPSPDEGSPSRDKFDNILLPITICCMHASMPHKRTSRRLRGYPPESQERVEVGSADEEAPGSARAQLTGLETQRSRVRPRQLSVFHRLPWTYPLLC